VFAICQGCECKGKSERRTTKDTRIIVAYASEQAMISKNQDNPNRLLWYMVGPDNKIDDVFLLQHYNILC
jgi:hypothetical protein